MKSAPGKVIKIFFIATMFAACARETLPPPASQAPNPRRGQQSPAGSPRGDQTTLGPRQGSNLPPAASQNNGTGGLPPSQVPGGPASSGSGQVPGGNTAPGSGGTVVVGGNNPTPSPAPTRPPTTNSPTPTPSVRPSPTPSPTPGNPGGTRPGSGSGGSTQAPPDPNDAAGGSQNAADLPIVAAGQLRVNRPAPRDPAKISFAQDILPSFDQTCSECHHQGTRLDLSAFPFRGGAEPRAVVEEMLPLIAGQNAATVMPPSPRDRLSAEEVELVRQWFVQGMAP
jgi:hypothetical protein